MTDWNTHIPAIMAELRKHERVGPALPAISRTVGGNVTEGALRAAFAHRHLPPPRSYCVGGVMHAPIADVPTSPVSVSPMASEPEAPPAMVRATQKRDLVSELVAAVKRKPHTLSDLADVLDVSPARVRAAVDEAHAAGFNVVLDGDAVGRPPAPEASPEGAREMAVAATGDWRGFVVASDIHFGSKQHLNRQLHDLVDEAYAQGIRTAICPGDMLDGVYRHSMWEQTHRGFEEQVQAAIEGLPQRDGMTWFLTCGNHEQTFEDHSGMDVGRVIQERFQACGRNDLVYTGLRGSYLRLRHPGDHPRGLIVEVWHPKKGPGYAKTYAMQNHIRDYPVGYKPDVLLVGHWHQSAYFTERGVHAMSSGTFQGGGSAYGKSLGGGVALGGWICWYRLTEHGTVRDFAPRFRAYYERETPRLVAMS